MKLQVSTAAQDAIKELKSNSATVNVRLQHLGSSVTKIKRDLKAMSTKSRREIKELGSKLDKESDDLISKLNLKTDKTDSKIDNAVYLFIASWFIKGAFDVWMKTDKDDRNKANIVGKSAGKNSHIDTVDFTTD